MPEQIGDYNGRNSTRYATFSFCLPAPAALTRSWIRLLQSLAEDEYVRPLRACPRARAYSMGLVERVNSH